jgi:hypothetical protein
MKKHLLIAIIAILLTFVGFSGCFGNNEDNNKEKFIGTWESATLLNQKTTTFLSNGTGFNDDGTFEWKLKDGQLILYWPDRDITLKYTYEFLNTEDRGEILVLTNTETKEPEDYRKII